MSRSGYDEGCDPWGADIATAESTHYRIRPVASMNAFNFFCVWLGIVLALLVLFRLTDARRH